MKDEYQSDREDNQLSKYSSGVSILMRIDNLWKNCHNYKRLKKYQMWTEELDSIWSELSRDLFKKKKIDEESPEFVKVKALFKELDKNIAEIGIIQDEAPQGFKQVTPEMAKARSKHYKAIMEKQEFLARLENYVGKGTTWSDEDEDDM